MNLRNRSTLLVGALLLIGCGGSGSNSGAAGLASLTVTLSDAARLDVTSLTVDVTALKLKHADGTEVDALSHTLTVDLARLSEIPQVLTIQVAESGSYTSASMSIDFTNSSCYLVNHTTPATLLDDDGIALTGPVTLNLDLTAASVRLVPGGHHEVEFDLDLDQSLTIDAVANTVNVVPSVVVRTDRIDSHVLVAQGSLVSVDPNLLTAVLDLETTSKLSLGEVQLNFDSGTIFQIDGTPSLAIVGIGKLAGKGPGTWVQAYVTENRTAGTNRLFYVEAGTGTLNGGTAFVDGFVLERVGTAGNDATLTVRGTGVNSTHTSTQFSTDFQVDVSFANTMVASFGSVNNFSANALNIGQRVQAYGLLVGTTLDATGASGIVREHESAILAIANGAPSGTTLAIDLVAPPFTGRVGPHTVDTTTSPFDWGHDNVVGRDPNDLQVDVGSLAAGLGIVAGTPVSAFVHFAAVDDAVKDATATTLANLTSGPTLLSLRDRAGGMTVVTQAASNEIDFALSGTPGADEKASLDFGFRGEEPLPVAPHPVVVANGVQVLYTLQNATAGTIRSFRLFSSFVAALGTALTGGVTLKDFVASGTYDATLNSLAASTATAVVK